MSTAFDDLLIGDIENTSGPGTTYLVFGDGDTTIFSDGFESGDTSSWSATH